MFSSIRLIKKIIVAALSISILLWLQGNILNWNYGLLDGKTIEWDQYTLRASVDILIWMVILILAIWKHRIIYQHSYKIIIFLIGIQLVALSFVSFKHIPHKSESVNRIDIDKSRQFIFSKEKNVIFIILDSFQTDVFQEIINEDPFQKKIFDGFTYFRNTLAGHPFTETSISMLLTGKYYVGNHSFEKHKELVFDEECVPRKLRKNGFQVDLYPLMLKSIYANKKIASNLIDKKRDLNEVKKTLTSLFNITFFRCSPQQIKKIVYNDQKWVISKDSKIFSLFFRENTNETKEQWIIPASIRMKNNGDFQFVNSMLAYGEKIHKKPVFKFYHVYLPHWPLHINEKLEYEKMEVNRNNYKRQCKAVLKLMGIFLNKLKEIDAFDNSFIIMLGDHGAGFQEQVFKAVEGFYTPKGHKVISENRKINALPVLLIKPFWKKGEMHISNAPVSFLDIPKTIFSELNIEYSNRGKSIFNYKEDENRNRIYISYDTYDQKTDYYLNLNAWLVSGPSWIEASWKNIGPPNPEIMSKLQ